MVDQVSGRHCGGGGFKQFVSIIHTIKSQLYAITIDLDHTPSGGGTGNGGNNSTFGNITAAAGGERSHPSGSDG